MITSLVFLIVGGAFVLTLFKGLFGLLSFNWSEEDNNGRRIISLFKWPLLCFAVLMIFIIWGIPYLDANNLK